MRLLAVTENLQSQLASLYSRPLYIYIQQIDSQHWRLMLIFT